MSSTAKTSKGTALPMIKLKGKDYLLIAHRLLWLNDDYENFDISTDIVQLTEDYAVVRSQVYLKDSTGNIVRSATASKRETKTDFADFLEKAETGSIGRALAMVGIGTQFAQQDMEEGTRLADAPLAPPPKTKAVKEVAEKEVAMTTFPVDASALAPVTAEEVVASFETPSPRAGSFRRDRKTAPISTEAAQEQHASNVGAKSGGWR